MKVEIGHISVVTLRTDVDVLRQRLVRVYRVSDPHAPVVYGPGQQAEAEPAVPGWTFDVVQLSSG